MPELKVIPYPYLTSSFNRIMVKPISKPGRTNDAGLVVAPDTGRLCEFGEIYAVGENSLLKPGDKVLYKKMDRSGDHIDVIYHEGASYDMLFENELWSVNDLPVNKIFVTATSSMRVNTSGLAIPDAAKGFTQKGIVFRSPADYSIKEGDSIEYRKAEMEIYPTIEIDGQLYDVLNETDVFIVNGEVAPYRIIVKIDKVAQQAKQSQTDSGLLRSQQFLFMKHNLQYGEVLAIGAEAQKFYPDMKVSDTAILHHSVEDYTQNYRVIHKDVSKFQITTYEHRIINAYDTSNREILGRIVNRDKMILSPYGKSVFLQWDFELLAINSISSTLMNDFETNLDKCHNLIDLVNTVDLKKKAYMTKASAKVRGTHKVLADTDPNLQRDEFDRRETAYKEAQADALKMAAYLNANHLLVCRRLDNGERVLVPYKELYPIEILGKKYLVGWEDFILGKIDGTRD